MIPCIWDCKNTTFFNISTFFEKLFFATFIAAFNPEPQTPHQPTPRKEQNVVNPLRCRGLISVLVDDLGVLLRRDVGVIISSRTEVIAFHQAKPVGHDPACQSQGDYHHYDGNHLENCVTTTHLFEQIEIRNIEHHT